jgi:hypothetical protein
MSDIQEVLDRLLDVGEDQLRAQLGAALAGYAVKWYWDGSKLVARTVGDIDGRSDRRPDQGAGG